MENWKKEIVLLLLFEFCVWSFRRNMENPVGYAKEEAIIPVSYAKQRVQYNGHHCMILWWLTHVFVPPVRETSKAIFLFKFSQFQWHLKFLSFE